jgi:excisionase family DNA binding protein
MPSLKRTLKDKEATKERLEKELVEDLAATAGQLRHTPAARSGSSRNPNDTFMFNVVDSGFLNWEAHEEARAILDGWKPAPWKGQVWQAHRNIDRVWTGPIHHDLQWNGQEWVIYDAQLHSCSAQDASGATDPIFAYPRMPETSGELTDALREDEEGADGDKSRDIAAEDELNATYLKYEADPIGQRESWWITLSAFARSPVRIKQVRFEFGLSAEMYMDIEDIFSEFTINLWNRIETKQYRHKGRMQNWIGFIWGNFFFPGIQTKLHGYAGRNTFVNTLDPDLPGGDELQNHAVGLFQIEDEQAGREQEGYAVPISRDRIFRQLNAPTQALVEMLAKGMTRSEIAVNLKLSPSQLRRRLDKAKEDGVLPTLQGCGNEDNVLPWPEENGFDISACAEPSENTLADMVEAFENAITVQQLATILQCSRREIYKLVEQKRIPALRVGTMIRLDPGQIAEWIRSKMTIAA